MNARSMTRTATMVAMALTMVALHAAPAASAPRARKAEPQNRPVDCRTLMNYGMSAWLAPASVVLTSPEAWAAWNREMVEAGHAVAEEPMPAGVDWAREAVVVLAMGEQHSGSYELHVAGATRSLSSTHMSLHVETGRGGTSPALVVAMDRNAARRLTLSADYTLAGMPMTPEMYEAPGLSAADASAPAGPVATTWGALKAEYR